MALAMVRLTPGAAWELRGRSDICRPLTDTARLLALERDLGTRVVAISEADHEDKLDDKNHIDGSFGPGLANRLEVDGVALQNTHSVKKIVIDWNRMPLEYAREAYDPAIRMIESMRKDGMLAQDCEVYLPVLRDQKPGPGIRYYASHPPFEGGWTVETIGVDENPLWQATTRLWPGYKLSHFPSLNQKTPFMRIKW